MGTGGGSGVSRRALAVLVGVAVVATAVVGFEPPAEAQPEPRRDETLPEPEPLDIDRDNEAMEDAVEQAAGVAQEEAAATEVALPPGALDGTAGADLFNEEDPSVLRPHEDGGAVYPPLTDDALSGGASVVDDGAPDEPGPLPPEELTEVLQETSDTLAEDGETGELVAAAQALDAEDLEDVEPDEEITELRTVNSRTFLGEDGKLRTELGSEPMFTETATGELVEPNPTPRGHRDGRWRPAAGRRGTSFGPNSSDDELGSMSFGEGRSISWGLDDARRAPGRRHGRVVAYDDVFEGVDLELEASLEGVKETIVITDPDAPTTYEFPLDLTGLRAELEDPYGSAVLVDSESREPVGVIPSAWAQDSAPGPNGETPDPGPVAYELVRDGADSVLRVKVDEAWFRDPGRVFPVIVDPTVGDYKMTGDTWIHSRYPTTNRSTSGLLKSGGDADDKRTYFARWDVGWLASATIIDATYSTHNSYSYSCEPRWFGVYRVTSNWNPATVTWGSQPSRGELLGAHNASYGRAGCPANWFSNPITSTVQRWVDGRWPAYGVTGRVAPNDNYTDSFTYKEFLSSESGGSGGQILQVTWSPWRVRYAYAGGYAAPTATQAGSIKIRVTNRAPTTWRSGGTNRIRLGYHVYRADGTTLVTWNGGQVDLPQDVGWGQSATVTVPLAPRSVGDYQYKFDLLQSGVKWFSQEAVHPDLMPLAVRVSIANDPPQITSAEPAGQIEVRTPTLKVTGVNPDNYPSGGLQYLFKVCEDEAMTAGCVQTSWQSSSRWDPSHLVWGKTYFWNAAVRETGSGGLTTLPTWKAPLTPTLVQPTLERHFGSDPYAPLHMGVNPSIGNYVANFTDVQVASAGLPVELTRTYNSMDTRVGAFGPGWSTFLDLSARSESGARLLVSFSDGHKERYGQNPDGSWASPPGNASVVRSLSGGGRELQRPDRMTYVFNSSGQLTAIRDGWGHELSLRRNIAGHVDRVTNVLSSRYMDLTWDTKGRDGANVVTSAQTNPAAAGETGPRWTYNYGTAGRLAEVCAPGEPEPGAQCTRFTYYGSGRGAEGKLQTVVRQEGNVSVELGYQPDGTVAWIENGTDDRWRFSDDDARAEGTYHPIAGWRAANQVTVNANSSTQVKVIGSGGIPDSGVKAVVVDIQSASFGSGFFRVYPTGSFVGWWQQTSTMDYLPGYRSNLTTVQVGSEGKITLSNRGSESAVVTFDVVGWYAQAGVPDGSVFVPLPTARVLDTRVSGQGQALAAGEARAVQITGKGGVPTDGIRAVVYDLEMVSASELTDLTTYASGTSRPSITTGITAGGVVDNLQITPVGSDGKITIHNSKGSVHVLVDVVGFFADPDEHDGSVYRTWNNPFYPTGARLLDTRDADGQWSTPWPAGGTRPILVAGEVVPARGVTAVVGDIQGLAPSGDNPMRSGPSGATNDGTTVIAQNGKNVGNHIYSGLGSDGAFDLHSTRSNDVIVDVVGYFTRMPRTAFVEDPRGNTVEYRYDRLGRLVGRIDQDGYKTAWAYDDEGFLASTRDQAGEGHVYSYDDKGHLLSDSLIRVHGDAFTSEVRDYESTTYFGYVDEPANPARDGQLAWTADGRSADADDTSYRTSYTYDDHGQPLTVRGPALPGAETGVGATRTYIAAGGAQPADCTAGLGAAPQGLLQTETDPAGLTTAFCYDPQGDLREVHRPSGLVEKYAYDDLGRATARTTISDSYPSGVTTNRVYDSKGRVTREIGPRVTSAIPNLPDGQQHRSQTEATYTPNGNAERVTSSDLETDVTRWMEYSYDGADRVVGTRDSANRTSSRTYDANGNVATKTGVDGLTLAYTYNKRDLLQLVEAKNVVDDPIGAPGTTRDVWLSNTFYDQKGRPWFEQSPAGTNLYHEWSPDGQLEHSTYRFARDTDPDTGLPAGPSRTVLAGATQFDRAGNPIATFAPSDVAYVDDFAVSAIDPGWQQTGSWSITDGELTAGGVGAMAWRTGATDGQVGLRVGGSTPLSVLFRVKDAQNYLKLELRDTALVLHQAVDGVEHILRGNGMAALTEGALIQVNFVGDRVRVYRNGAVVMDTELPAELPGQGVGVVAMAGGQTAESFRFDAYSRTENSFDAYGRPVASTIDPGGANMRAEVALLPDGRPQTVYVSNAANPRAVAQSRYGYDPESGLLAWTEDVVADPDPETLGDEVVARTGYGYDQRGLVTSTVSPEGSQVNYGYDEIGQLSSVTGPPFTVEGHGQPAQPNVRPTGRYAYTGFGELDVVEDPAGRRTRVSYDDRGFPDQVTLPSYTASGSSTPVERTMSATYDDAGRVLTDSDPLGATTGYTYNTLGHLVARHDPAADGDPAGVWRFAYDDMGRLLEQRDPTGGVVRQRLDGLGRVTGVEEVVRQPELVSNVSAFVLSDAGGVLRSRTAEGVVATSRYDLAGRLVESKDADGNATSYTYDGLGRLERMTTPDGRQIRTGYDLVGNTTNEQMFSVGGSLLGEARYRYDLDGRLVETWSPRGVAEGFSTGYAYDLAGQVVERRTPVAPGQVITESWGYDILGQAVRYTDGRGNATWQTYNSLGLPEDAIEPAAGAHTALADRRWRSVYDAAGRPVTQQAPGGVTVTSRYDELGRLVEQAGTGGQAQTATRSFDYDPVGRMVSASTPAGSQTFAYDDRGLLLSSEGIAGSSSFVYDGDGRVTRRTDSSGVTDFTYDNRGLPDTMTSGLSGTVSFDFDEAGRPTTIDYGDGTTRTYGYDDWGRLDTDTLATGSNVLYGVDYGYDPDGSIVAKNVTGTDVPAAGLNRYDYDWASRLTSWTNPANAVEGYEWDAASNRTRAGDTTAIYDEQNRLVRTEGPGGLVTSTWLANGTLDKTTTQQRISLVVADPSSLTQAENTLVFGLTAWGGAVTLVDDAAVAPGDGVNVVVLSPDVDPAAIGDKYKAVAVPVVNLASGTWQANGLTNTAPTTDSATSASVAAPEHQVGAGRTGTVTLLNSADSISSAAAASLGSGATTVWTSSSTSTDAVVAVYDAGGATPDGATAAARRVLVGLSAGAVTKLTSDGAELVKAAVGWADDNDATFGTTNFDFDAFEQLSGITTPTGDTSNHTYDPLGRRLTSPTGALTYAGTAIRPSADGAHRYQPGPLGVIGIDDTTDGGGQWAHADQHTDVVAAFTPGATTLPASQAYDPWGKPLGTTGDPLPLGYQSERQDLPGGLIGMGVREYNPQTGTFITHDPIIDPGVLNGYSYTSSNPMRYTDPTGTHGGGCWSYRDSRGRLKRGCFRHNHPYERRGCIYYRGGDRWCGTYTYHPPPRYKPPSTHCSSSVCDTRQRRPGPTRTDDGGSTGPGRGGGGSRGGGSRGGGSGGSRPAPAYRTPDSVIRNGPLTPAPDSATATRVRETGSAVPNYPGRYQTDSSGRRVDTGNASIPTTPVVPTPISPPTSPASPEIVPQNPYIMHNEAPANSGPGQDCIPHSNEHPPSTPEARNACRPSGGGGWPFVTGLGEFGSGAWDYVSGTVSSLHPCPHNNVWDLESCAQESVAIGNENYEAITEDPVGVLVSAALGGCDNQETAGSTLGCLTAHVATIVALKKLTSASRSGLPALRQAYVNEVRSIADDVAAWRRAGVDAETIARRASAKRRALGIHYKDLTTPGRRAEIYQRNIELYGDPLGPTVEWFRARGKTWEEIAESASRPGGRDLGL